MIKTLTTTESLARDLNQLRGIIMEHHSSRNRLAPTELMLIRAKYHCRRGELLRHESNVKMRNDDYLAHFSRENINHNGMKGCEDSSTQLNTPDYSEYERNEVNKLSCSGRFIKYVISLITN